MIDVILLVLLLGAAVGAGSLPLGYLRSQGRREDEEVIFSLALGLGMLILGVLLLGLVRGLHVPAVIGLVVCWGGLGLRQLLRVAPLRRAICKPTFRYRSFEFWFALLAILGVLFQLFRALAPPHGATDPLAYQLALPKLYLVKHFLSFEAA